MKVQTESDDVSRETCSRFGRWRLDAARGRLVHDTGSYVDIHEVLGSHEACLVNLFKAASMPWCSTEDAGALVKVLGELVRSATARQAAKKSASRMENRP
ncbi:MAG: hypothetical protein HOP18_14800 [Deltaproteobacteria bacterium]|nr:hypothetical protein [Deltaproteobacteria bacterium]